MMRCESDYFQPADDGRAKPFLAFKLDSRKLEMLPAPKPLCEIFVYSPEVEGAHLRFGRIARGGIRWSDRPEDFRTEILSLAKAQQVKNSVIVPVGAKGGSIEARPPWGTRDPSSRGDPRLNTFFGALLELADNIGPADAGAAAHVSHYGDDPYIFVVQTSDSDFLRYCHVLSEARRVRARDAFASGGSAATHKNMGSPPRAPWKRSSAISARWAVNADHAVHGRGVGDISGDVFGTGCAVARAKLVAASTPQSSSIPSRAAGELGQRKACSIAPFVMAA